MTEISKRLRKDKERGNKISCDMEIENDSAGNIKTDDDKSAQAEKKCGD